MLLFWSMSLPEHDNFLIFYMLSSTCLCEMTVTRCQPLHPNLHNVDKNEEEGWLFINCSRDYWYQHILNLHYGLR